MSGLIVINGREYMLVPADAPPSSSPSALPDAPEDIPATKDTLSPDDDMTDSAGARE